jgi:MoaA/NifB/PqqE/SkfB family radical SAM enzyme
MNLIRVQDISLPVERSVPLECHDSKDRTYVMRGDADDKALDIYHLIFAPTHACNLRCRHCYLPDHDTLMFPKAEALRLLNEWSKLVSEERGPYGGIFHVKGGEPLIVPYLWELVDRLASLCSLRFMITTNATLFDPEALERSSLFFAGSSI